MCPYQQKATEMSFIPKEYLKNKVPGRHLITFWQPSYQCLLVTHLSSLLGRMTEISPRMRRRMILLEAVGKVEDISRSPSLINRTSSPEAESLQEIFTDLAIVVVTIIASLGKPGNSGTTHTLDNCSAWTLSWSLETLDLHWSSNFRTARRISSNSLYLLYIVEGGREREREGEDRQGSIDLYCTSP